MPCSHVAYVYVDGDCTGISCRCRRRCCVTKRKHPTADPNLASAWRRSFVVGLLRARTASRHRCKLSNLEPRRLAAFNTQSITVRDVRPSIGSCVPIAESWAHSSCWSNAVIKATADAEAGFFCKFNFICSEVRPFIS